VDKRKNQMIILSAWCTGIFTHQVHHTTSSQKGLGFLNVDSIYLNYSMTIYDGASVIIPLTSAPTYDGRVCIREKNRAGDTKVCGNALWEDDRVYWVPLLRQWDCIDNEDNIISVDAQSFFSDQE
jgi:hypothetical protein